ncbi:hypothetical protein A1F94_002863 [Pyrenophora tritici-repentis]|nr:hypothetical protein A1F94_002863 [Pyrenophora tritici-repentis]
MEGLTWSKWTAVTFWIEFCDAKRRYMPLHDCECRLFGC